MEVRGVRLPNRRHHTPPSFPPTPRLKLHQPPCPLLHAAVPCLVVLSFQLLPLPLLLTTISTSFSLSIFLSPHLTLHPSTLPSVPPRSPLVLVFQRARPSTTSFTFPFDADKTLLASSRQRRIARLTTDRLTIQPTSPTPQPPNMPQKKIRCTFKECKDAAQRIVGDCGFCNGHFCGKHRLLEDHKCDGLEDCKKQSHERNAAQLEAERTQVIRGV
ncbi:AN1-type zinc finger protein TMC1 [Colletotrichum fructicola]|nr:AN1-type zinc finger protein TMC1 [Colletotrichum fructicola]